MSHIDPALNAPPPEWAGREAHLQRRSAATSPVGLWRSPASIEPTPGEAASQTDGLRLRLGQRGDEDVFHSLWATAADPSTPVVIPTPSEIAVMDVAALLNPAGRVFGVALAPHDLRRSDPSGSLDAFVAPRLRVVRAPGAGRTNLGHLQEWTAPHTRCWLLHLTLETGRLTQADVICRLAEGSRMALVSPAMGIESTAAVAEWMRDTKPGLNGFIETVVFQQSVRTEAGLTHLSLAADQLNQVAQCLDYIGCSNGGVTTSRDRTNAYFERAGNPYRSGDPARARP